MLMGVAAFVVDLGSAYAAQRNLQSSADAADAGAEEASRPRQRQSTTRRSTARPARTPTRTSVTSTKSVTTTCIDRRRLCLRRGHGQRNSPPEDVLRSRARRPHLHDQRQGSRVSRTVERQGECWCRAHTRARAARAVPTSNPGTGVTADHDPTPTDHDPDPTTTPTTTAGVHTDHDDDRHDDSDDNDHADHNGDDDNNTGESASPTLGTRLSTGPVTVGTTVNDTATLTGRIVERRRHGHIHRLLQQRLLVEFRHCRHGDGQSRRRSEFERPHLQLLWARFYWEARYSGDAGNHPALSPCTSEDAFTRCTARAHSAIRTRATRRSRARSSTRAPCCARSHPPLQGRATRSRPGTTTSTR